MKIIPILITYYFEVLKHTMRAEAEHSDGVRKIRYYFDEKQVTEKIIPDGHFLTDDDIIREFVDNYSRSHIDMLADIFSKHSDTVHLTKKNMEVLIENYGININVTITETADQYDITMSTEDGCNTISGKFKASNFSEVLEKLRIFINTLEGVSDVLSQNIDEFSNDKVMEKIKWQK
jgi:hypothetical protein